MKTNTKLILSGLGLVALTYVAIKPVDAFAPMDWMRATYQTECNQEMAKFFGLTEAELQKKLDSDMRPYEIAEEQNVNIADWRNSRTNDRTEHRAAMGITGNQGFGNGLRQGRGMMGR